VGVEKHGEAGGGFDRDGHPISADTVRKELVKLGFSRQSNRKANEGSKHPDRNAQFEYINAKKSLWRRLNNNPSSPSTRRRRS
jgi:Rhodopirellula transposase DDE domain